MSNSSLYVLKTGLTELQRLQYQHQIWSKETHAHWARAGFGPGQTLLDLGCGPGLTTLELGHLVGTGGRVDGVDTAEPYVEFFQKQIETTGASNVRVQNLNFMTEPLSEETYDGVYSRFVFWTLAEPQKAVERVVKATRPGGTIAVFDFAAHTETVRLFPRSEAFEEVIVLAEAMAESKGGSLRVQETLPTLFAEAGCEVQDIRAQVRATRPGEWHWNWVKRFYTNIVPELVESGAATQELSDRFWSDWQQAEKKPGAYLTPPMAIELVVRKPS